MRSLLPWLVVALVIRVLLIVFTLHPDIRGYNFGAYLIAQKGMFFNFYDYISLLPSGHPFITLYGVDLFIYPPLAYLFPALFMKILSPVWPWAPFLALVNDHAQALRDYSLPSLSWMMVFLKGPYLLVDFACFWLIGKVVVQKSARFFAQMVWLFNPVTLYVTYMVSQFDILLAFFILLALFFYSRRRGFLAAASLGLGAGVKMFPLFLLPFLALIAAKGWPKRIAVFAAGAGFYLLVIAPYVFFSPAFRLYALLAPQTDKVSFAKLNVSVSEYVPLFLLIFFLLLWLCWFSPLRFKLWQWFLFVLLAFYSLTNFHPQWFVWVSPLLVALLVSDWKRTVLPVAALLVSYVVIVFLFDPTLSIGLFSLYFPSLEGVSVHSTLERVYGVHEFASVVRGFFAATSLYIAYFLFKSKSAV